ncbi:protein YgfX [Pseudomonas sp. RP23018S]|uniref:protein YgfX n=1 Tax=Pseudomonas sp. RP23018S TaxID=3096037 RepID=UPI002ACAA314|nr:protein YgfX [Pseudomonas sp. RP23018S]MDZ5601218.1 protein YgfX [Pseudomonas sp. RP23018S]
MSSPSEAFECRWQGSRLLLTAYLACLALALCAAWLSAAPAWLACLISLACATHAGWTIPRHILLTHPGAITGLRRSAQGWAVFTVSQGWQPARLCRDSLALPQLVVVRVVRRGRWLSESQCVAADGLPADQHRRLRVRLRFGRQRWQAA